MIKAIENSDTFECKIIAKIQEKRTKALNYFWKFWSFFGLPYLWILLTILFYFIGNLIILSLFLLLFVIYSIIIVPLKLFIKRPRPQKQCSNVQSLSSKEKYSFPSGHTFIATAFGLVMAFQFSDIYWFITMLLLSIMVATSRIYLGAHFLTDVIFSYILAVLVVLMIWWILFPFVNLFVENILVDFYIYL